MGKSKKKINLFALRHEVWRLDRFLSVSTLQTLCCLWKCCWECCCLQFCQEKLVLTQVTFCYRQSFRNGCPDPVLFWIQPWSSVLCLGKSRYFYNNTHKCIIGLKIIIIMCVIYHMLTITEWMDFVLGFECFKLIVYFLWSESMDQFVNLVQFLCKHRKIQTKPKCISAPEFLWHLTEPTGECVLLRLVRLTPVNHWDYCVQTALSGGKRDQSSVQPD